MKLCIAAILAGAALAAGSGVARATGSPAARGGHAVAPKTTKAPHPGWVRGESSLVPSTGWSVRVGV